MIVVYGLKTCEGCRKALAWLRAQGIGHRFHDLRADGLEAERLAAWLEELGCEALVNRRSASWRALAPERRAGLDAARAQALILERPALMKRPLFDLGGRRLAGFGAAQRRELSAAGRGAPGAASA